MVRDVIDFSQPVGLLLVAVLHFVQDDEDPWGAVAQFRDMLAPGSYLVLSHMTSDDSDENMVKGLTEAYSGAAAPGVFRTARQIGDFFDGFDLEDPGVVHVSQWRPPSRRARRASRRPVPRRRRQEAMRNVPRREPCPRPAGGRPRGTVPGSSRLRTAGDCPGAPGRTGGWEAVLRRELEFLAGTARLVSLLAQFEAVTRRPGPAADRKLPRVSPGNARNARKGRRSGPRPHAARTANGCDPQGPARAAQPGSPLIR